MAEVRYLDKLIDELAQGKSLQNVLRTCSDKLMNPRYHEIPAAKQRKLLRDGLEPSQTAGS